jgi:hypothetical protein
MTETRSQRDEREEVVGFRHCGNSSPNLLRALFISLQVHFDAAITQSHNRNNDMAPTKYQRPKDAGGVIAFVDG